MKDTIYQINEEDIKIVLQGYSRIILKILKINKKIDIKMNDDLQYYIQFSNNQKQEFDRVKKILNYCKKFKKYDPYKAKNYNVNNIKSEYIIKVFKKKYIVESGSELYITIDNKNLLYPCYILDDSIIIDPDFYLKISDKDGLVINGMEYVCEYITCKKYELNQFNEDEFFK